LVGVNGLKIDRRYTTAGEDPYSGVTWQRRDARITNPDGSVVFEMEGAEVPAGWSRVASDIIVSKYFRKAGVPTDGDHLDSERSARQVFDRLAGTWRRWGERLGYFASAGDAAAFEDEMRYQLCRQMGAPNSPQWFNTGLNWAYGLTGPPQGFWFLDPETGEMAPSPDSYSHPAPHACFILKVEDDLVNPGGIMDLWLRESRVFKFGAGAGSNFSAIRAEGERLSGGGTSSGVMSFLRVGDRAAGAIKSGGTTRRAAKMVILDIDHPDIEAFINWKKEEEEKARILIEQGGFPADFNGEAYATVSGQNSNNSVRVTDRFLRAVESDGEWRLTERTTGRVVRTVRAGHLWNSIAAAAWACADPGVQFDTTINDWHTCPEGGPIRGSNPCSEYMFLDNTACNLASLNLVAFYDEKTRSFDVDGFLHTIRLWTIMLEISVAMAHFPSREVARGSYDYRTLGLGYTNLGSLLMRQGIPYDSPQGRAVAGAVTAVLTGHAYATSAEIAQAVGPFPRFDENREAMLRVIRNHRRAESVRHGDGGSDTDPQTGVETRADVHHHRLDLFGRPSSGPHAELESGHHEVGVTAGIHVLRGGHHPQSVGQRHRRSRSGRGDGHDLHPANSSKGLDRQDAGAAKLSRRSPSGPISKRTNRCAGKSDSTASPHSTTSTPSAAASSTPRSRNSLYDPNL